MTNNEIFNDPYAWDVWHSRQWSVDNMTDDELRTAIIHDILCAQYQNIPFNWYDIFRFLSGIPNTIGCIIVSREYRARVNRVLNALVSDEVMNLIQFNGDLVRIREGRVFHQAAMDYAGVWFEDFPIPPGVTALCLSPEGRDLIENLGVEGATTSLLIDMQANTLTASTIH